MRTMSPSRHLPVMPKEVIESLELVPGLVVVDATLGGGGHSQMILDRIAPGGHLIAIDRDSVAIARAKKNLIVPDGVRLSFALGNFRQVTSLVEKAGVKRIDRILFDFGLSSDQLIGRGLGFSFQVDEPLLMSFGTGLTAYEVVNGWEKHELERILREYAEENFARVIAQAIVDYRKDKPIETSMELAEVVSSSLPIRFQSGRINPATKTFQAIRIATLDELGSISQALESVIPILNSGAILSTISFHSLEDRIVKQFAKRCWDGDLLQKKSRKVKPTREEVLSNPRSRSALLRTLNFR